VITAADDGDDDDDDGEEFLLVEEKAKLPLEAEDDINDDLGAADAKKIDVSGTFH